MISQQEIFEFNQTEGLSWTDFIDCNENHAVLLYLMKWPDWPVNGAIITGSKGTGKTHLSNLWKQSAAAINVSLENVENDPRDLFKQECNFIFDDFSKFLPYQKWLFDFYNVAVNEKHRFFLLIDQLAPSMWNVPLSDLKSRLKTLPVFTIQNYKDDTLLKVLKKIVKELSINISDNALRYLINTQERNISTISEIIKALDRISLSLHQPISIQFIKRYL